MKKNDSKRQRRKLPDGVEIGQNFLLSFDDPRVEAKAYQGRLHQLSRDGLLCFDAPGDLRPRRGTQVTIQSLKSQAKGSAFSSEIRGRGRLGGHLPVLLVEAPVAASTYRRDTYRVSVCLRGKLAWQDNAKVAPVEADAVLTNISGGGAQLYSRCPPTSEWVHVTLNAPQSFVEEQARRHLPRGGVPVKSLSLTRNPVAEAAERVQAQLTHLRARAVSVRLHSRDERGPVYAVSLAYCDKQEACFQLVRYLERQALHRCAHSEEGQRASPKGAAILADRASLEHGHQFVPPPLPRWRILTAFTQSCFRIPGSLIRAGYQCHHDVSLLLSSS
ncbi:MAG: hypothetical protein HOM68_03635 [Gemmatimonadetes bacterium]|jgi:hypothetical protein|nr:hypothetical protein [Gemmatimonadota bacterium]MBT5143775.1 hypothetical protein [Gemmatimonadota bacterium]MBT5590542.1 hypothetical protein [Gemmatimonadota bacterium]MBT5965587.1 hypothetical protein [Gemmatimonadota bacterium]MBT7455804.1 hypothetical protein [Gemmatimonadota bacterium]